MTRSTGGRDKDMNNGILHAPGRKPKTKPMEFPRNARNGSAVQEMSENVMPPQISERVDAVTAWSRYWQGSNADPCFTEGAGVFLGKPGAPFELPEIWAPFAQDIPDNAKVLDLATGSGSVVRQIARHASAAGKTLRIVGIDYANIPPPKADAASGHALELQSGVRMEELPYTSGEFDGATSQYGLEYSDLERSLPEIARVLRPGAPLCAVMHTDTSVIVSFGRSNLQRIRNVDRRGLVNDALKAVTRAEAYMKDPSKLSAWQKARDRLKHRFDELRGLIKGPEDSLYDVCVRLLAQLFAQIDQFDPNDSRQYVRDFGYELESWQARLQALSDAALDEAAAADLRERLGAAGFESIAMKPVCHGPNAVPVGAVITARRTVQEARS